MLEQVISIFRPTTRKTIAAAGLASIYIIAAFMRVVTASLIAPQMSIGHPFRTILLRAVNLIILTALLYLASSQLLTMANSTKPRSKRTGTLISMTIIGILLSPLFFEMPRFLASSLMTFTSDSSTVPLFLVAAAELILSYIFVSLMFFIIKERV